MKFDYVHGSIYTLCGIRNTYKQVYEINAGNVLLKKSHLLKCDFLLLNYMSIHEISTHSHTCTTKELGKIAKKYNCY